MHRIKLLVSVMLIILLLLFGASLGYAASQGNGYLGVEYGDASLNSDTYLYSPEANQRQPELNIRESNQWDGPATSIFIGYNFASKEIDLFGAKPTLKLGFQGGFTNLGEYVNTVLWGTSETGTRKVEERSLDLLFSSTLIWENGFNISGKFGVACLNGKYEDRNLPSPRQPELPYNKSADLNAYRPELAVGVGYLIKKTVNINLQYTVIFGDEPSNSYDRFTEDSMVSIPNKFYQVDRLTLGVVYTF